MKTCNRCKIERPTTEFYKKPTAKDGLFWWCRDCHKQYVKKAYHEKTASDTYREKERLRIRTYHSQNPEKVRRWYENYKQFNTAKLTANARRYVLMREKRTPRWLQEDDFWLMEQAYELAGLRTKMFGFPWHVDHVLPLRGKLVSGFHVPHNLQVIPARDNRRKSNRFAVST